MTRFLFFINGNTIYLSMGYKKSGIPDFKMNYIQNYQFS